MDIKWSALGKVASVSFAATVVVVFVFALGVMADAEARHEAVGSARTLARASSALCFLSCAAVVIYGIYLIIPQFH